MDTVRTSLPGDGLPHRLNNILSRIIACAEGAIDAADDPAQVRALMELIIECAESAPESLGADRGAALAAEPRSLATL